MFLQYPGITTCSFLPRRAPRRSSLMSQNITISETRRLHHVPVEMSQLRRGYATRNRIAPRCGCARLCASCAAHNRCLAFGGCAPSRCPAYRHCRYAPGYKRSAHTPVSDQNDTFPVFSDRRSPSSLLISSFAVLGSHRRDSNIFIPALLMIMSMWCIFRKRICY